MVSVRVTGLEPVRQRHTHLKRACLPVPAHSHITINSFLKGNKPFGERTPILYHHVIQMSIFFSNKITNQNKILLLTESYLPIIKKVILAGSRKGKVETFPFLAEQLNNFICKYIHRKVYGF